MSDFPAAAKAIRARVHYNDSTADVFIIRAEDAPQAWNDGRSAAVQGRPNLTTFNRHATNQNHHHDAPSNPVSIQPQPLTRISARNSNLDRQKDRISRNSTNDYVQLPPPDAPARQNRAQNILETQLSQHQHQFGFSSDPSASSSRPARYTASSVGVESGNLRPTNQEAVHQTKHSRHWYQHDSPAASSQQPSGSSSTDDIESPLRSSIYQPSRPATSRPGCDCEHCRRAQGPDQYAPAYSSQSRASQAAPTHQRSDTSIPHNSGSSFPTFCSHSHQPSASDNDNAFKAQVRNIIETSERSRREIQQIASSSSGNDTLESLILRVVDAEQRSHRELFQQMGQLDQIVYGKLREQVQKEKREKQQQIQQRQQEWQRFEQDQKRRQRRNEEWQQWYDQITASVGFVDPHRRTIYGQSSTADFNGTRNTTNYTNNTNNTTNNTTNNPHNNNNNNDNDNGNDPLSPPPYDHTSAPLPNFDASTTLPNSDNDHSDHSDHDSDPLPPSYAHIGV